MLFDVYDDITGQNYSRHWTYAAARRERDAFHAANEIGIEGETPRAVAPVWQRWDWRARRLLPGRGYIFTPDGDRRRGVAHRLALALIGLRHWLAAVREDGWRAAICGHCRARPTLADDMGLFYTGSTPCCRHCWEGAPGDAHRAAHGRGER